MKSIPQTSTFTALATTLQYEDEYAGEIPLLQLFSVTPEILHGSSGNSDVNNAVDRLVKVLSLPRHADLARYLEGPSEKNKWLEFFSFPTSVSVQRACSEQTGIFGTIPSWGKCCLYLQGVAGNGDKTNVAWLSCL